MTKCLVTDTMLPEIELSSFYHQKHKARLKTKRITGKRLLLILPILLLLFSCTKKPDTLGLDLVDDNKGELGYDTSFNVLAFSELEDSVASYGSSVSLMGSMQTATFGRIDASFYTQLRLSEVSPDFGDPEVDSVVLTLVYAGNYGNINTQQTVKIFRVTDTISIEKKYSSKTTFPIESSVYGDETFTPKPNDSILIDSVAYPPALRIHLENSFGDTLLNLESQYYESSTTFVNHMFGILVKPDPVNMMGEGAILYFDLIDDRTNLTIYYHDSGDPENDSLSYVYLINANCARVGNFSHDYSLSADYNFLTYVADTSNHDTVDNGRQTLYLEGLGGVKTILKFPEFLAWAKETHPVLNEAKLVINAQSYDDDYAPPERLVMFQLVPDSTVEGGFNIGFTPDQSTFTDDYFGGNFNESKMNYTFRITLYLQSLILGEPDYGLTIFPNGKSVKANGVVLTGTDHVYPQHMQLQVIYTKTD